MNAVMQELQAHKVLFDKSSRAYIKRLAQLSDDVGEGITLEHFKSTAQEMSVDNYREIYGDSLPIDKEATGVVRFLGGYLIQEVNGRFVYDFHDNLASQDEVSTTLSGRGLSELVNAVWEVVAKEKLNA